MRNTIINAIHAAAKIDKNIYFITGDLGYSVIEKFQTELPEQFINAGIAEQNMVGIAAGLALAGKKVFVFSIVPFITMRCFEQIRVDVCYQNLDVNLIGVGGGFAYGTLGPTHYGLEDMSLMRTLPNMKIIAPTDPAEADALFAQLINTKGPWYIRLNRGGEKNLYEDAARVKLGLGSIVCVGSTITIFSIGAITEVAIAVANQLKNEGLETEVVHIHTLKPLDKEIIIDRAKNRKIIITLEEHMINGGLGSAVAEVIAENNLAVLFKRIGINDEYSPCIGKQDYVRMKAGLSVSLVVEAIKSLNKDK